MKRVADRHEGMVDDLEQRLWNLRNKRWKCNYHFTFADQCLPCKENMCEYHTMVMKGPKKRNLSWGCQKCKEIRLKRFAPLVEASQQPVPPSKCEEKPPEPESAIPAPKKATPRYKPVVRSTAASKKKKPVQRITKISWCDNHRVARGKCRQCIGKDFTCRTHTAIAKRCPNCHVSSKPGTLPTWILQCRATKKSSKKPEAESPQ